MRSSIRLLTIVSTIFLLIACVNFQEKGYTSTDAPIKSLLIAAPVSFPKAEFGVDMKNAMLGLVGKTISMSSDGKTASLDEILEAEGAPYHRVLLDELEKSLATGGIYTETIKTSKEKHTGLVNDYRNLPGTTRMDAILDIAVLQAGYIDPSDAQDAGMRPVLQIRARLVSTKNFETLYAADIAFGHAHLSHGMKVLPAPKAFYFWNSQQVIVDSKKSAEGLRTAATLLAQSIAQQFTR